MRHAENGSLLRAVAACAALAIASGATLAGQVSHPFILWTKSEAAAIRKRIESDEVAKKQYEAMVQRESKGVNPSVLNLFKYAVLGDQQAGEAEKRALVGFIGHRIPASVPGNPNTGNAPYRDDQTINALRYDVLYEALSDEQRKGVRDTFDSFFEFLRTKNGPWRRCPGQNIPRTGWLPNMQWPTVAGIHVMAVATGDEALIKEVFETVGCFKWWLDVYIADGGFYMEEFGKYSSHLWSLLLWCEGLEKLGLSKYGYGYTAPPSDKPGFGGGGNLRNYLGSLIRAGYPRVARGEGMPDYPCVNMGDAGSQAVVAGVKADGTGGNAWWAAPTMWGQPKMMHPMWWEYGCRRFPEDGYDYFLAQMRKPGEDVYLPSLLCGLGPIDSRKVKPPAARSYVAPERGFALLRAEESPAYWESPQPAVGLQFGMYYVHYVHDCFSILQYVAHNRFIYNKMGGTRGGYAGGDPWRDHVRGQGSGVVVDGLQIQPVDTGDEGCRHERIRQRQAPTAKYVAVRAAPCTAEVKDKDGNVQKVQKALYPGVDAERALVLTNEYLFDVSWLKSGEPHVYDWHVLAPATLQAAEGWTALEQSPAKDRAAKPHLSGIRTRDAGAHDWKAILLQDHLPDGIGVKVWMLGAEGTLLVSGKPPIGNTDAGVKLLATRQAASTVFVALHEPFKGGPDGGQVAAFERIAQNEQGVAVAITGKQGREVDDRILLRYGDEAGQPLTLGGRGESFTFSDSAFVRVGKDTVTAEGPVTALRLKVSGTPKLLLNGKEVPATVAGGVLELK